VRDLIVRLKESGRTVMFSSHILHDAELLCDRVAMIMKGKLVACGLVSELIDHGTTQEVEMVVDRLSPEGIEALRPLAIKTVLHGERVMAILASQRQVDEAIEVLRAHKAKLVSLIPYKASLEDLFIRKAKGVQQGVEVHV
jgi:ABC-2 type transport system ATP-binding protein